MAAVAVMAWGGCVPASPPPGPVSGSSASTPPPFASATVWVHSGPDTARLSVEVAETPAQHEVGLSGREALAPDVGMLFLFDRLRGGDEGFWMYGTAFALDVAFIDERGTIVRVLTMQPCAEPAREEDCPGYFPGVAYASALEVAGGWFGRLGFGAGARVTLRR